MFNSFGLKFSKLKKKLKPNISKNRIIYYKYILENINLDVNNSKKEFGYQRLDHPV